MRTEDTSGGVILSKEQCLDRLGETPVGRIGLSIGALPVIFPIQCTVVGNSVLFPTDKGSSLGVAASGAVVAFQADAHIPAEGLWWSVLLQGVATPLSAGETESYAALFSPSPWTGPTPGLLRIPADNISGRLFRDRSWVDLPAGTLTRRPGTIGPQDTMTERPGELGHDRTR